MGLGSERVWVTLGLSCVQSSVWWGRQWGLGPGENRGWSCCCGRGWAQNWGPPPSPHFYRACPQGSQATQDEIAASAYQAVILDQKYNDEPVQIRVPMGKEPPHLMAIFKGRMVVYQVWLLARGAWQDPQLPRGGHQEMGEGDLGGGGPGGEARPS